MRMQRRAKSELSIEAWITADVTETDYGVPRSPILLDFDNYELDDEILIEGVPFNRSELPEKLLDLICESLFDPGDVHAWSGDSHDWSGED